VINNCIKVKFLLPSSTQYTKIIVYADNNNLKKGDLFTNKAGWGLDISANSIDNVVFENNLVDSWVNVRNLGELNRITDKTIKREGRTGERPLLTDNTIIAGFQFFDWTLGKPIFVKGAKYSAVINITNGATSTGDIVITLNGVSYNIAVVNGDSIASIVLKIYNTFFTGFSNITYSTNVAVTKNIEGVVTTGTISFRTVKRNSS